MICPSCGAAEMLRDTRNVPYKYKGKETVIPAVTGEFCPKCEEFITGPAESRAAMSRMLAFNKEVDASIGCPSHVGSSDR